MVSNDVIVFWPYGCGLAMVPPNSTCKCADHNCGNLTHSRATFVHNGWVIWPYCGVPWTWLYSPFCHNISCHYSLSQLLVRIYRDKPKMPYVVTITVPLIAGLMSAYRQSFPASEVADKVFSSLPIPDIALCTPLPCWPIPPTQVRSPSYQSGTRAGPTPKLAPRLIIHGVLLLHIVNLPDLKVTTLFHGCIYLP